MGCFDLVLVSSKGKDVEVTGSLVEYIFKFLKLDKVLKSFLTLIQTLQDILSSYQLSLMTRIFFEAFSDFIERVNFLIHNGRSYYRPF